MSKVHNRKPFQVGDRVHIDFGRRRVLGEVVEDRGPIGVNGRRLYQVSVPMEPDDPMMVELPEDEMLAATTESADSPHIETDKIVDYLQGGGLVAILRGNHPGTGNQPRAWLCLDQLGNVTHTFLPERGMVGGEVVPSASLLGEKVIEPKRNAVVNFVESFGLSQRSAEQVVAHVGITA